MFSRPLTLAMLMTLALSTVGCASSGAAGGGPEASSEFEPFRAKDIDGKVVDLRQILGKDVILVSFWATWCEPCKAEMPFLQRFYDTHRDKGLSIVSVSIDSPDTVSEVKPYIRKQGYTFPVVVDKSGDIAQALNPTSTAPYALLVARDGRVAKRFNGFQPSEAEEIEHAIIALLDEKH